MADISRLSRLVNGIQRQVDLSSNTLVLDNLKVKMGSGNDANHATFSGTLTAARTISMPDANVDLGQIATNASGVSTNSGNITSAQNQIDAHENGGASKHDASEIDVESDGTNYDPGALSTVIASLDSAITSGSDDQVATEVPFTPTTGTDWVDPDPTEVGGALDDLASRVTVNDTHVAGDGTDHSAVSGHLDGGANKHDLSEIDNETTGNYITSGQTGQVVIDALDSQIKTNADNISALSAAMNFQGSFDASSMGSQLDDANAGDYWVVTVAGTILTSLELAVGDHVVCVNDVTGTPTQASDFSKVDNTESTDIVRTGDTGTVTNTMLAGSIAYGKLSLTDSIVNADINSSAAIAESKLNLDYGTSTLNTAITNHTGNTSNPHSVTKSQVLSGDLIVNADIDASAAILTSKLADATELAEAVTFFGATGISGAEAETLTDGSSADSLHAHGMVKKSFVAGEAFAANTVFAVRLAVNGENGAQSVNKADNDASSSDEFHVIGLVYPTSSVAQGEDIGVIMLGEVKSSVAFGASQDEGKAVYLGSAGAITLTPPTTTSSAVVKVGTVFNVGVAGTAAVLVNGIQVMGVN